MERQKKKPEQNKIRRSVLNPLIYEKTANGEEIYDVFSRLMKDRIVFIGEDITPDLVNCLVSQLLWLEKQEEDEPIHLYINSGGGDLTSMFAIYDIMQLVKSPIYTYCLGIAASAAAVLLSAGSKGNRYALPNSEIMIHQPLAFGVEGQVTDVSIISRQLERSKTNMIKILARHSGKSYEQVEADCQRDLWLNPTEAIKYGLIDKMTTPSKELPSIEHVKKPRKIKKQAK